MEKWTSKEGLSAIFKDVAFMSVTMMTAFSKSPLVADGHGKNLARYGGYAAYAMSVSAGIFAAMISGKTGMTYMAICMATYLATPNVVFGALACANKDARNAFFPRIAAHANRGPR